jgi:hypothetical protein
MDDGQRWLTVADGAFAGIEQQYCLDQKHVP